MLTMMGTEGGLEPRNLAEAKHGPDWLRWKEEMEEELNALQEYKTWEIVDDLKNVNIVRCRWTYMLKKDSSSNITHYKAHQVAQGFSQVPGIDFFDTYAPVTKMATIRTVPAFTARHNYEIHQVYIKNAFLNGKFEEKEVIYMKLPPGVELTKEKGKVLRLLKLLYGLHQSTRHWYKQLWGVLSKGLGILKCEVDQAAFHWHKGDKIIIIIVHVNDLTIVASSIRLIEKVKHILKEEFKIPTWEKYIGFWDSRSRGTGKGVLYHYHRPPISGQCLQNTVLRVSNLILHLWTPTRNSPPRMLLKWLRTLHTCVISCIAKQLDSVTNASRNASPMTLYKRTAK